MSCSHQNLKAAHSEIHRKEVLVCRDCNHIVSEFQIIITIIEVLKSISKQIDELEKKL